MLILLPPSEGKSEPVSGRPAELARLSLPQLKDARQRVFESLVRLCAHDPEQARTVLGLSAGQGDEIRRNAELRNAPTAPAGTIYTGVLYDALDLTSLPAPARRRAERDVLVFSGLWGALRLTDRIPAYRCSIGVKLPGLGALSAYWRSALSQPIAELAGDGLVLDLRSSAYAAMWGPARDVAPRTVAVRVLHERLVDGAATRTVVSHFNKATKGRLVRDLVVAGAHPRSAAQLASALRDLGYAVEEQPAAPRRPGRLDVVVTSL